MTPTIDLIKARLKYARNDLDEVLARLDQTLMDWAPSEGMRKVAGQLIEIAGSELQIISVMKYGHSISDQEVRALIGDTGDFDTLKAFIESVRRDTLAYLDSLSPEELDGEITVPKGWHEGMGFESVPRAEIFRSIAQHEAYHTGQIVSYLWSRGDDPYKW